MTDATTGPGAESARRGEKTAGDRSMGPKGERSAPLVAGHGTRDTSDGSSGSSDGATRAEEKDDGSRSPLVAGPAGHEAAAKGDGSHRGRLLPHDECDKLSLRLQHAVAGFVDGPRTSVEEADRVMEEVATRVTDALTRRRRTLRTSWQDGADKQGNAGDTEQLRLALRDYRELADRLLHL
ncbi:hypothetical protein [Streptomyces sp. NPDC046909]|uniref:hypothetical protein n=1 Tax=Streptomyces sp. NPDC046909 TaxID=3155617 RepID=UPI0033F0D002